MKKRGLSDVITTVLIILLSLAAIVLLWFFIRNFLSDTSGKFEPDILTSGLEAKNIEINNTIKEMSAILISKSDKDNIKGVQIILSDSLDNSCSKRIDVEIKALESKRIILNYTDCNLSDIVKIGFASILLSDQNKSKVGLVITYKNGSGGSWVGGGGGGGRGGGGSSGGNNGGDPPAAIQCNDGVDNDGDGKIDFGIGANNDIGCSSATDDDEYNLIVYACNDGIDNDEDNLTDLDDPNCVNIIDNDERGIILSLSVCSDNIDNDGDGKKDYPQDLGCESLTDIDETDPGNCWCTGADSDKDGDVDLSDLGNLAGSYGNNDCSGTVNNWCNGGDMDKDGDVDLSDLGILSGHYGENECMGDFDGCYASANECIYDTRSCLANSYRICKNYDNDEGLEWGSYTSCSSGEVCHAGNCIANIPKPESYYSYNDVLLVCNSGSAESMEICNYFISKRGTMEVIYLSGVTNADNANCVQRDSIKSQIKSHLDGLNKDINYIVLTKGIPIRDLCTPYFDGTHPSLDMTVAVLKDGNDEFYVDEEEIFSSSKFNFYIVTRLDGYTVDDVKALIDRSGPNNVEPNALTEGKFVLDEAPLYYPNHLADTKTNLEAWGYNVVYGNVSIDPKFIREENNVLGYYSFGGNDEAYQNNIMINNGFDNWADGKPSDWILSGSVSQSGNTAKFVTAGNNRLSQQFVSNLAGKRRYYYYISYSYENFVGDVNIGMNGMSGTNIINENKMNLISSGSPVSSSAEKKSSSLRYYPKSNSDRIESYIDVNLQSGSFTINEITVYEISPTFSWKKGAIATTAVSYSARSFSNATSYERSSGGMTMIADLIHDGASGAEGFAEEPGFGAVANPEVLFDRYAKGYNLGDSYYMSSYNVGQKDVIIGDPKTVIVR